MKKNSVILLFVFIIFYNSIYSQNYIEYIDKVKKYQKNVKTTSNKNSKDTFRRYIDTTTFSLNEYMQMFNLLKFKDTTKNYCFYYFYFYDFETAYPCIIVKEKDTDFQNKVDKFNRGEKSDFNVLLYNTPAKDFLISTDSYMGYLQYLYFCELGNKFALFGYANRQKKSIITSKKEMNKIIKKLTHSNYSFSQELKKTDNINFVPKVSFTDDEKYCEIEWIEERPNGIYQCKYKISRTDFSIMKVFEEKLLSFFSRIKE